MRGEKQMQWLDKLKIAIIEKNTQEIEKLLETLPEFKDLQQMQEAQYLIKEAATLVYALKDETMASMQKVKKNLSFLRSTQVESTSNLDIKS